MGREYTPFVTRRSIGITTKYFALSHCKIIRYGLSKNGGDRYCPAISQTAVNRVFQLLRERLLFFPRGRKCGPFCAGVLGCVEAFGRFCFGSGGEDVGWRYNRLSDST